MSQETLLNKSDCLKNKKIPLVREIFKARGPVRLKFKDSSYTPSYSYANKFF